MASAHAVVLNSANQLLLLKRSLQTTRSGQWSVPGGRLKPGETVEMAAEREVFEESGLSIIELRVVHQFTHQTYLCCNAIETNVVLATREASDFVWIEPRNLLSIGPIADLKQLRLVLALLGIEIGPRFDDSDPASS